jgi:hypothetical protein
LIFLRQPRNHCLIGSHLQLIRSALRGDLKIERTLQQQQAQTGRPILTSVWESKAVIHEAGDDGHGRLVLRNDAAHRIVAEAFLALGARDGGSGRRPCSYVLGVPTAPSSVPNIGGTQRP